MKTEFAVRAETHEGNILTLRRGFDSEDAAKDHPVQIYLWRRVWVEPIGVMVPKTEPALPPKPWNWVASMHPTANASYHLYLIDATGRKIAAIWGKKGEKELTAAHIIELVNAGDEK